ncbi:hypothetical protein KR200_010952 [Drosophila serrata]|nr:hypothetical protein KR200_010952 [Drosophila serrata]
MQENINKMTELVAELHQEKPKIEGLQQQEEQNNNNDEAVVQQLEFSKERDSILLQLQEEMCNYATIQSKFQEHEQSMELIVKELQQQKFDLEKERDDLKEALAVKEMVGLDELEQLDVELEDISREVNDLNNQVYRMTEATICPLCLAPWASEGDHRVVTLRCGHLFGDSCLRECIQRNGRCPICRKRSYQNEVRNIYYGQSY